MARFQCQFAAHSPASGRGNKDETGTHLQEDLSEDAVCFFSKNGRKYDCHPVSGSPDINCLFVAIVHLHQLPLVRYRTLQLFLFPEGSFKRSRQSVPLEKRNRIDESVPGLC